MQKPTDVDEHSHQLKYESKAFLNKDIRNVSRTKLIINQNNYSIPKIMVSIRELSIWLLC